MSETPLPNTPPPRNRAAASNLRTATRARRGLSLAPHEKECLIELCIANRGHHPLHSLTKAFWVEISRLFLERTGRVYSWQSCRRCLRKWELDTLGATSPQRRDLDSASGTDILVNRSLGPESPATNIAVSEISETANHENHFREISPGVAAHDAEAHDEFLPDTPVRPIHRDLGHRQCQNTQAELRDQTSELVLTTMNAFRAQLECFSSVLSIESEDKDSIQKSFENLEHQVQTALTKYQRRSR